MRHIKHIDVEESVKFGKLIYQEEFSDKLDRIVVYLMSLLGMACPFLIGLEMDISNSNDRFVCFYILPLIFLISAYVLYRKATEKHLIKCNTGYEKDRNKKLIRKYIKKFNLKYHHPYENVFLVNDCTHNDQNAIRTTVFIIQDLKILYIVLYDRPRLNLPSMTSHFIVKYDLKSIIKNTEI